MYVTYIFWAWRALDLVCRNINKDVIFQSLIDLYFCTMTDAACLSV
jgi:hypothetical protein